MNYEDVRELVRSLPVEMRAKLIEEELKTTGLTVIFGGNNTTTAEIVLQIHGAKDIDVDEILGALASRIKQDKKKPVDVEEKSDRLNN
ncbi:hypothetical protein NIES592_23860 [Fischerella major NIES-592]|uniref:Uncharacterized protein n=1 Tax=Fischerella major NIES-592 TaxID=210994 RepID=A0A1U7GSM1_9CYAN|nr:hypothetical protein [Fischerella major]OKH10817.1 hypothetical protein NIES592_23860 [Fischerella major NIES-592]